MQPPNDLVRACLRWTVPAITDTADDPRRYVTNEGNGIRGMPDLAKSDQRQVTRACVADTAVRTRATCVLQDFFTFRSRVSPIVKPSAATGPPDVPAPAPE